MSADAPTPLRYHGPGWELDRKGRSYYVWAPGGNRDQWAAAWDSVEGSRGDFRRGATLADVLVIFPMDIAGAFVAAAYPLDLP